MPNAPADEYLIAALWAAAAAWSLWTWTPVVVGSLGGSGYQNGGTEDPAALEPDGRDPAYARVFAALRGRGYEPLGPGFMRLTFQGWWWVYRTRVWAFRSRAARRFAFLQRHPFPSADYLQVYFATCYAGGRILLTSGGGVATHVTDESITTHHDTENVAELEERHAEAAADRARAGWEPDPDLSLAKLLENTDAVSRRTRGEVRRANRVIFVKLALPHLGMTALVLCFESVRHWLPPVVNLGVLAYYRLADLLNRHALARAAARRAEADRAAVDRDDEW